MGMRNYRGTRKMRLGPSSSKEMAACDDVLFSILSKPFPEKLS